MNELQNLATEHVFPILSHPQFIGFILACVLEVFRRILTPKASIIWGTSHGFNFLIPQIAPPDKPEAIPNLSLNTQGIIVKNNGRAAAKNIEIYFNYKPEHMEMWPVISRSFEILDDGRYVLKIPYLRRNEFFNIELIHTNNNVPHILNVRAEEAKCKEVPIIPMQMFPKYINYLFLSLIFLGVVQFMSFLIYLIF